MVDHDHTANPADIPLKRCTKCGETKPCAAFSRSKSTRDGLQLHCKQCNAQYHSDNADKISGRMARWYRENVAKVSESSARYYRENADKMRDYGARWYRANLDKSRAAVHRRRATKRALPSQWSDSDIHRMLTYWDNRCAICEQKVEPNNAFYFLAADHWIALTSPECPGTVPWNMLPLCHSRICNAAGCNSAKHDADPIEWLNRLYPDDPKLVAKILARIAKYFKTVKA